MLDRPLAKKGEVSDLVFVHEASHVVLFDEAGEVPGD